jgi:hypothetical protein
MKERSLYKRDPHLLPHEDKAKRLLSEPESRPSPDPEFSSILILDFPASIRVTNNVLFSINHPNLYFVVVARMN